MVLHALEWERRTHNGGNGYLKTVAMDRRELLGENRIRHADRWGDHGEEAGFGISTRLQDNEHDIVVIDATKQELFEISRCDLADGRLPDNIPDGKKLRCKTFDQVAGKVKEPASD